MSFFENITEKAKQYANIAADKATALAEAAADKAKDVKETAQLNMAIKTEQREMEKNYRAIGQWFVSEYEGEVPDAVKDVVAAQDRGGSRGRACRSRRAGDPCRAAGVSNSLQNALKKRLPRQSLFCFSYYRVVPCARRSYSSWRSYTSTSPSLFTSAAIFSVMVIVF